MRRIILISMTFAFLLFSCRQEQQSDSVIKLIIDTDFGANAGDIDDMGALTIAHSLMNNNECKIVAVVLSINNGYAIKAADAVNTYFGRGDIPIAVTDKELVYQDSSFAYYITNNFPSDIIPEKSPKATDFYRELLSKMPDNSINLAIIGYPINIFNLFKSGPDKFSNLNGIDLVAKKIKCFYIMGGEFPKGQDVSNFRMAGDCVAKYVIENSPRPIVFNDINIGMMKNGFKTGHQINSMPDSSIVKQTFAYWFRNVPWWYTLAGASLPPKDSISDHHLWDEITVHTAVRGTGDWFKLDSVGSCEVSCGGFTTWNPSIDKPQSFLKIKMDPQKFSDEYMLPLMMAKPINRK